MFILPNDIQCFPKGKIYIPINSFLELYENKKFIKIGENEIDLKTNYLKFIYNYFKETHDLRCGICGIKASHFRIAKNNKLYLYCFKKVGNNCYYSIFNKDHVIPNCRNFSNERDNLILTCEYCNQHRGTRKVKYIPEAIEYIDNQRDRCLRNYILEILANARHSTENPKLKFISNQLKMICRDKVFDDVINLLKDKVYIEQFS